ncbi:hypothetical protein TNCV_3955691 [Trichonephila clavipes]|nr:hypothetical protein TNCV_3955691 [Trichonephila clavipes]
MYRNRELIVGIEKDLRRRASRSKKDRTNLYILRTERSEGKRSSEAVLRLNSASEKESVLLKERSNQSVYFTDGALGGKEIFGSSAAIEFSFGEGERLAQRKIEPIYIFYGRSTRRERDIRKQCCD